MFAEDNACLDEPPPISPTLATPTATRAEPSRRFWPSEREYREHVEATTLSKSEWQRFSRKGVI